MSDQFLAEIRMVGFNFAPVGWAQCSGQIMPITQNTALFSLLGTTFGGDGRSTFGLPNFQAVTPMAFGNGRGLTQRSWGETGGNYSVTLTQSQDAVHTHGVACITGGGSSPSPVGNVWADDPGRPGPAWYATTPGSVALNAAAVQFTPSGGAQPHNNLQPYLAVTFIIALQGIFPPRG